MITLNLSEAAELELTSQEMEQVMLALEFNRESSSRSLLGALKELIAPRGEPDGDPDFYFLHQHDAYLRVRENPDQVWKLRIHKKHVSALKRSMRSSEPAPAAPSSSSEQLPYRPWDEVDLDLRAKINQRVRGLSPTPHHIETTDDDAAEVAAIVAGE